jgi:hypothetical protein
MSYIDPDQFHGAVDDLITHITNNAAALTAAGVDPTITKTKLGVIRDDVAGKKGIRDQKKTELGVAQNAFALSAANQYTSFSSVVDTVSGGLGKTTPAGKQALGYRTKLNAAPQHHASPSTSAPPPAA